jgi:hypothetical protein
MGVRIVAEVVEAYELEILTGPTEDEEGRRAELTLLGEQGGRLANITFYGPEATLGPEFVSRANLPLLQLHTDMLSSVLALLDGEKPLFFEFTDRGRLTTTQDF